MTFALAIHAGAGASHQLSYDDVRLHLRATVESARHELECGKPALDVVMRTVEALEASGLYVAGKGGSPNSAGDYELEASIIDGATRRAGAVTCLRGFQSPIRIARAVMEHTDHVLLAGAGAEAFASAIGEAPIPSGEPWFTHAGVGESNFATTKGSGTVGCVALDIEGRLASATSTAGVFDKVAGRVGDCPIIGAGGWADDKVAISCTGQGDYFIRTAAAAHTAFLVQSGMALDQAAICAIAQVATLGGEGGLVAVDHRGSITMPYTAEGMKRAALHPDGRIEVAVFET